MADRIYLVAAIPEEATRNMDAEGANFSSTTQQQTLNKCLDSAPQRQNEYLCLGVPLDRRLKQNTNLMFYPSRAVRAEDPNGLRRFLP